MARVRRDLKALLEEKDPDGKRLIEELYKIAFGERTITQRKQVGDSTLYKVEEVEPTIKERLEALGLLSAYHFGRPKQSVEVEDKTKKIRWNPDALSLGELQELERIARKAVLPETTETDAEIIEATDEDKDKPK